MTLSASRRKANDKYIAENYSRIALSMPNAEAQALREYCAAHKLTVAGFIRRAITEKIERETQDEFIKARNKGFEIIESFLGDCTWRFRVELDDKRNQALAALASMEPDEREDACKAIINMVVDKAPTGE